MKFKVKKGWFSPKFVQNDHWDDALRFTLTNDSPGKLTRNDFLSLFFIIQGQPFADLNSKWIY